MVAPAAIFCACVSRKRHSLRLCGVMKTGLAGGGGSGGKGIQCACAPMAERVRYCGLRIVGVIFEFSEHSEHSEGLADARLCLV